jgi:predicted dinucleotide-binding enzyme
MVDPMRLGERTQVFVSGNDIEAKATVVMILRDWFDWKEILDLGDITTSRSVEMFLPLWQSLRKTIPGQRFNIKVVSS